LGGAYDYMTVITDPQTLIIPCQVGHVCDAYECGCCKAVSARTKYRVQFMKSCPRRHSEGSVSDASPVVEPVTHNEQESPADLNGWTLCHDKRGIHKAVKRIDGKLRSVYVGKDPRQAAEKIVKWMAKRETGKAKGADTSGTSGNGGGVDYPESEICKISDSHHSGQTCKKEDEKRQWTEIMDDQVETVVEEKTDELAQRVREWIGDGHSGADAA